MEYKYIHVATLDAVGFFDCRPDPEPSLDAALAMLADRPLDEFLFRYCLRLLSEASHAQVKAFSGLWDAYPFWARLLADIVRLRPDLRDLCSPSIQAAGESAPSPAESDLPDIAGFYKNIHQHAPPGKLSGQNPGLVGLRSRLAARKGVLASKHASLIQAQTTLPGQDLKKLYARAVAALENCGIISAPEMRHEASLSPIALLREWNLDCGVSCGQNSHHISGRPVAYGRGLTLAQARVSCVMEIVERASAFGNVEGNPLRIGAQELYALSVNEIERCRQKFILPAKLPDSLADERFYWVQGEDRRGNAVLVPAQTAYLFLNLDEPAIFDLLGSTGLGAGECPEQARLSALLEVVERYSHATTPYQESACFQARSRNPMIQGLLDDYRWRGIHVQFQDITSELGVPVFRCFVKSLSGEIAQATGAGLSGMKAALAAMTETPWPYSCMTGQASPSARAPEYLPVRILEELPDYDVPGAELRLLEDTLAACGLEPVYVNLTRPDIGLPVCRALIPGLEVDTEFETNSGAVFAARLLEQGEKHAG